MQISVIAEPNQVGYFLKCYLCEEPICFNAHVIMKFRETPYHTSVLQIEKSGYLMSIQSESRMKSLKRRWCVLRNGRLMFYKSAADELDGAQPVHALPIVDVDGVTRIDTAGKSGHGFEVGDT
jgi:hypothetical protein